MSTNANTKKEVFANMMVDAIHSLSNSTQMSTDIAPLADGWDKMYVLLNTILFSFIICAGLFGNSIIMATLARWREMRTPCNLLIANICAADLGVCVFAAPLRIVNTFRGWIFGEAMCYVLTPIQDVLVVVSVVTQTVIAFERHRAITAPLKPKMTRKRVKMWMVLIWLMCYITAGVPMMIFLQNKLFSDGYYDCSPVFTRDAYRIAYEMYLVLVFIVLPLGIQSAAYFDIIRVLRAKGNPGLHSHSGQRETIKGRIRQKRRLVRMLLVLMLTFQVCYLPRGVIMLLQEFTPQALSERPILVHYVKLVILAMYYLKHVSNPLILWAMSKDFRTGCLSVCTTNETRLSFIQVGSRYQSTAPRRGKKSESRQLVDSPVD